MENEPPTKRHSLLPQRSTSSSANASPNDETGKLMPPVKPKQREVSPSKLPIGGTRRTQSIRQLEGSSKQPVQKLQSSVGVASQDGLPSITPVRTRPITATISSKKTQTLGRSTLPNAKQTSQSTRTPVSHRSTASASSDQATSARRPISSGKDTGMSTSGSVRTSSKTLANVKVQRPSQTAQQRPSSPRKAPRAQATNKYALLTTPPIPAGKQIQDAKIELLHLHSLHQESHATKADWLLSAKQYYGKHFRRLIQLEEHLKASEMEFVEQQNASALIGWCKEVCAATGESKVKGLASILNEMWLLVSPGGRYTAAVDAFEDWYEMVEKELGHRLSDAHADIMEGLGDGWKAEVDALMSALCRMSDELEVLGPAVEPSDLARCLNVLMTMLASMLEELVLVRDIESRLVEREGSWVKGRIEGLSAQISSER